MNFSLIAFVILVFIAGYGLSKLKPKPVKSFPKNWHDLLLRHVVFYEKLSSEKQKEFQQRMMQFLSEVYIDSVQLEIEELDKLLIASSAVIPVFGFKEWKYTNLSGVMLYPDNFNEDLEFHGDKNTRVIAGLVGTGRFEKHMILSKKALYAGFAKSSYKTNTAIHEFVHLIDKMDGETDGFPETLVAHTYAIPWLKQIHNEMQAINNNASDIRNYGGTNEAEFFAVASEYFFEQPELMADKHPELYAMLINCFNIK